MKVRGNLFLLLTNFYFFVPSPKGEMEVYMDPNEMLDNYYESFYMEVPIDSLESANQRS